MRKMCLAALAMSVLFSHLQGQGVVITLSVKDLKTNRQLPDDRFFAQDGSVRIQTQQQGRPMTLIFSGGDFIYQDDQDKSFVRMNQRSASQAAGQVQSQMGDIQQKMAEAMKQMEVELDKMDPKQRAMVESLMKGKLGGMQAGGIPQPQMSARRVEAEGSDRVGSVDCMVYAVYRGADLSRKICAAETHEVDGIELALEGFRNMSASIDEMRQSFGKGMGAQVEDSGFELMEEIGDRFPVSIVEYDGGQPVRESLYKSSVRQQLSGDLFAPCQECQEKDPFQMGEGPR